MHAQMEGSKEKRQRIKKKEVEISSVEKLLTKSSFISVGRDYLKLLIHFLKS